VRITRGVFLDVSIWMVAFGLCTGVAFPFFVIMFGVSPSIALKPMFFAACLGAGTLVGIVNYTIARWIVGARLRALADSMNDVEQNLKAMIFSGDLSLCTPDNCMLPVDSQDEIGESAQAFNRLVKSLSIATKAQAAVRSFTEMLTSELEIESLAEKALLQLFEYTGATGGLVLCEPDGEPEVVASLGLRDPDSVAANDRVLTAMRTGQSHVMSMPDDIHVGGASEDFRPAEVIIRPILCKGEPLGVVVLAAEETFDDDDRALIDLLLETLGLALRNAQAHDALRTLSVLDPLTGVYNRRFGLNRLHEEFTRTCRGGAPMGVLMFDVDHFKAANDTQGHAVGDRILASICDIARSSLREGDILFRYGGDEFCAVLPEASAEDLQIIGERLRKSVGQSAFSDEGTTVRVTVSVGGAACPSPDIEDEDVLIRLADEALYEAKSSGRNRVEISRSGLEGPTTSVSAGILDDPFLPASGVSSASA